ncbi:sulfotransferase [Paracoccus sp. S1E-3]|uniref:sulfotransferase n=1 Tax=Paracoccus sp. S1E-3 TaxID=2756130 RepID=UPI0015EE6AF1|nr:sulfotransferase [Paracoccus sp. S1E-3]MBA4491490.1 sulfotransferase [Paracoccus sp. S1E-3]
MTPKFVICGMEHTGTTLISDLFRQIPGIDSGFECGVLLRATPSEFRKLQPFASHMLAGWGITAEQLDHCCAAPDFVQFYQRLMQASTAISDDTVAIFDKTPRYLSELTTVLERCDCPVLVSHKDPRAIVCSDFKRAKTDDFHAWYAGYRDDKLGYVKDCYNQFIKHRDNPRVAAVSLEDLAMNSRATMERMFAHVGERFDLGYAIIDDLRYDNVRSRTVSPEIAFEYRRFLGKSEQEAIMKDFGCFDAWIYS